MYGDHPISWLRDRIIDALAGPVADAVGAAVERKLDGVDGAVERAFVEHDKRLADMAGALSAARFERERFALVVLHAGAVVDMLDSHSPLSDGQRATYAFGPADLVLVRKLAQALGGYGDTVRGTP